LKVLINLKLTPKSVPNALAPLNHLVVPRRARCICHALTLEH